MTLADDNPSNPTMLFIGPAGSGKTTFMARFGRVLIIDIDKNLNGPTKVLRNEKRDLALIEYVNVDRDESGAAVGLLQQYQRFDRLLSAAAQRTDLDLIGITSTTTLAPVVANEVRRQLNKSVDYTFEIRDWGKYLALWQHILTTCRTLKTPVALDGHWEGNKDDVSGAITYSLAIPGKASHQLPALFSDVLRFDVENVIEGGKSVPKYSIHTVQERLYPGVKVALDMPPKFEATQANADKMRAQFPRRKEVAVAV